MDMWFKFETANSSNISHTLLSNSTTESPSFLSHPIDMMSRWFTLCQFSIIGSLGIITNIFPVVVTALGYVRRNVVNCMVVNLACCELLLCTSFVFGQSFYVVWREYIPIGWCHLLSFLHFVAAFASFMFPPLLAFNRYVALYKEEVYQKWYTKRRIWGYMVGCWSFCAVIPFIFLVAGKTGYDEDNDHCCMVVKDATWIAMYWLVIIMPLLTFCDGVMIFCNYKIYIKLKKHAEEVTSVGSNVVRDNKELLYFLLADMMFPICFHSMYHIFKFILINRTSEFLKRFFISLYLINSILRGTVTISMLRPYRKAVLRLICRKDVNASSVVHPSSVHKIRSTYAQKSNVM